MDNISTILIVDDEPAGRDTMESLLMTHGYHLEFARNGREALEKAAHITPDLILLDIMMPGMDGYDVCRQIRTNPLLSEVPVIIVTALDDRESRIQGIEAGADDFVSKPFDRNELRARIRTITRLNRYRRLHNERERFERLIQLSPDGILIGTIEGRICLVNPSMTRMLGANNDDAIIGRDLDTFLPYEQVEYASTMLSDSDETIQDVPPLTFETRLRSLDGTERPVEVHGGPIVWDDKPAIQFICRDSTERKKAEQEHVRLLEKLAERERRLQYLVEKLIASQEEERRRVAYEIHDGLAQVASGTLQHLQSFASLYHPHEAQVGMKLDQALACAQQVVKEARRVIAGMRPTALDDFGLASALRMQVENLRSDGWDVSYEESVPGNRLPPAIETALFRVAQEALNNIRKHAACTRVRLALVSDEHSARLEVQDWGCGFDVQQLPHAGSNNGHHIGLLSMEERVSLLEGELTITSQLGEGTLVIARVPLPPTEPDHQETLVSSLPRQAYLEGKARLIIADDHELSRAGLRSMLEGEPGMELVGEASNGREALDLCKKMQPDLALLDVRMPEMDGLQATRAIKQHYPGTSVIIVTMEESANYLLAAMRAGAAGYLLKDTSRREFLGAIRHVLRGESFLNTDLTQRLLQNMSDEVASPSMALPEPLTPREIEVLNLLTQGMTNRQIAANLVISPLTVKVHVQRIIAKLDVSDRTQAAVRAVELGLTHS